jgi:MFS family permease
MSEQPVNVAGRRRSRRADPMTVAVLALGITQITAWGTSYYCLGVLAGSIASELGWTRGFVFLGFTVSVLVMALISTSVGRLIDRVGGRAVMSAGSIIVAIGLFLLSLVRAEWAYLAVWVLVGVGMRLCLYDAAFAAIVQVTPTRGRMAISYLTLFGAFASSVFWVVGHYLDEALGWRQTLVVFAALNLAVCLPLHWFGLARREQRSADTGEAAQAAGASPASPPLEGQARTIGIVLFALIMSLNGFVFGVVSVQLVPLLEGAGLAAATAVWLASLKGVAQFAGRVVEITLGRNLSPIMVARLSMAAMVLAFALLYGSGAVFGLLAAFTFLMGAAQGVLSIVRGTVPLALFGAKGYGAVTGLIATPILFVSACAPTIFAWIVDRWGWSIAHLAVLGTAATSFVCMEAMALWHRRHLARLASGEPVHRPASG